MVGNSVSWTIGRSRTLGLKWCGVRSTSSTSAASVVSRSPTVAESPREPHAFAAVVQMKERDGTVVRRDLRVIAGGDQRLPGA